MPLITNPIFNAREKTFLEFVLSVDFPERSAVATQLNGMRGADITRDITPHYCIIEFRPNGINAGQGPMRPYLTIEVLHGPDTVPTAFTLYQRNGAVFELEIYNADSSEMDLDRVMCGDIRVAAD